MSMVLDVQLSNFLLYNHFYLVVINTSTHLLKFPLANPLLLMGITKTCPDASYSVVRYDHGIVTRISPVILYGSALGRRQVV